MAIEMPLFNSLSRRQILRQSLIALGGIATSTPSASRAIAESVALPTFAAVARHRDDRFSIVLLTPTGDVVRDIPLSARGHDIAVHAASGKCVAFARRPGTFAVAFCITNASEPIIFQALEGRHFFGHGAFSVDGKCLYVSENNVAKGEGAIGIYDVARGYIKIGEFPSYGVGPHEIIALADGKTLAIANGGLDTSPEAGGRENLNTDAMKPNLAFIDLQTGTLAALSELPSDASQLSLRHIVEDRGGRIWFGGQWHGNAGSEPGLVGVASRTGKLDIMSNPKQSADLKGYIGSVALSADGRVLAASAPKGSTVLYFDTQTNALISTSTLQDVCGLAPAQSGERLAETSGFGIFRETQRGEVAGIARQLADLAFDNHVRRLT